MLSAALRASNSNADLAGGPIYRHSKSRDNAAMIHRSFPYTNPVNPLLPAFQNGLFSDILVSTPFGKTYRLHRVILSQSPFFGRQFVDRLTGREIIIVEGFVALDFEEHALVTHTSLDRVLRSLYAGSSDLKDTLDKLSVEEALQQLVTACFLELENQCDIVFDCVVEMIATDNIIKITRLVDQMVDKQLLDRLEDLLDNGITEPTEDEPLVNGLKLIRKYYKALRDNCLHFLCQMAPDYNNLDAFAQLPFSWIKEVGSSNLLVVRSEFERYEFIKNVLERKEETELTSIIKVERNESAGGLLAGLTGVVTGVFSRGRGKRKASDALDDTSDDNESTVTAPVSSSTNMTTAAALRRSRSSNSISTANFHSPKLSRRSSSTAGFSTPNGTSANNAANKSRLVASDIVKAIFENSITYTYMTFGQLDIVKSDQLINPNIVLTSFWMQQELTNRCDQARGATVSVNMDGHGPFPPFRFAAKFTNVRQAMVGSTRAKRALYSDPIYCAGVQYRAILQLAEEDNGRLNLSKLKALVQRSRAEEPADRPTTFKFEYEVYVYENRNMHNLGWKTYHEPVTKCLSGGEGYAHPFDVPPPAPKRKQKVINLDSEGSDTENDGKGRRKVVEEEIEDEIWLVVTVRFA